jgi:hypothetical protein
MQVLKMDRIKVRTVLCMRPTKLTGLGRHRVSPGVEALSKGLQGNGNLTQLNLDNAMVGDDGLSALADMLIKNAAIRSLTMRYNCFTHRVRGITQTRRYALSARLIMQVPCTRCLRTVYSLTYAVPSGLCCRRSCPRCTRHCCVMPV